MARLQEIFMSATQEAKNALCFYEENYTCIGQWILEPAKKVVLRSSQSGVCRFCGLSIPNVTFRNEAHAIPECLGNRSLTTEYECDDCNQFFGVGIENDFGNWSKAQRALSGVRGKKGVPVLKEESNRQWRFEHGSAGIMVTQDESNPIAVVDEATKQITLTGPRDRYTPVAVLKAFTKMALSLLPEEELPNFRAAMMWIRNADHQVGLVKTSAFPVLYTFVPGNNPLVNSIILLRRRSDNLSVPYVTFVLAYGNEVFQTILPSPERDVLIYNRKVRFPFFPTPYELDHDLKPVAPMRRELIDLTGRSLIKGETIQAVIGYGLSNTRDDLTSDSTSV
ncbi:MAG: HNH endonuclease [Gammaproteobacteria bacterium]